MGQCLRKPARNAQQSESCSAADDVAGTVPPLDDSNIRVVASGDLPAPAPASLETRDASGGPDGEPQSTDDSANVVHKRWFIEHYEARRLIGEGVFGEVWLAVDSDASSLCALKVYNKSKTTSTSGIDRSSISKCIHRMRSIHEEVQHHFILPFLRNFETEDLWCTVVKLMDHGSVGDRLDWLRPVGLPEAQTKFYVAQTMSAIKHLHSLDIVHRGIRSDVLLLESDGFCKLGGFFSSRHLEPGERTHSLACGDAHYMAPEMILSKGHGRAVDHYAIGVLSYELLVGTPPYLDEDMPGLYRKIIDGKLYIPGSVGKPAASFIKKLMTADLSKRLGRGPDGFDELTTAPWFQGLDWQDLERRSVPRSCEPLLAKLALCGQDAVEHPQTVT